MINLSWKPTYRPPPHKNVNQKKTNYVHYACVIINGELQCKNTMVPCLQGPEGLRGKTGSPGDDGNPVSTTVHGGPLSSWLMLKSQLCLQKL